MASEIELIEAMQDLRSAKAVFESTHPYKNEQEALKFILPQKELLARANAEAHLTYKPNGEVLYTSKLHDKITEISLLDETLRIKQTKFLTRLHDIEGSSSGKEENTLIFEAGVAVKATQRGGRGARQSGFYEKPSVDENRLNDNNWKNKISFDALKSLTTNAADLLSEAAELRLKEIEDAGESSIGRDPSTILSSYSVKK